MRHHFVEGDRVRLAEAHRDGATDQFGTVIQTYPMPGVYAVHFDGEAQPRVVAGSLLADVPSHTQSIQSTMTFQSK
jgi:hypothetical protein